MVKLRSLPKRDRVVYAKNPLVEVVAAVNFPTQLSIANSIPVEFQERIKDRYPRLTVGKAAFALSVVSEGPAQVPKLIDQQAATYLFASEDQKNQVALSSTMVALTTTSYTAWEDFSANFNEVLDLAFSLFKIPLVSRIGLRYKDVIDRDSLGMRQCEWTDLIQPELLTPLTFLSGDLNGESTFGVSMSLALDVGRVNINYGFVKDPAQRIAFLIDTDCYVDTSTFYTTPDIKSAFEGLHQYTSLVFGAAITNKLHAALRPSSL
jgi:uncharacterized protein (TIGR04255 family)